MVLSFAEDHVLSRLSVDQINEFVPSLRENIKSDFAMRINQMSNLVTPL